MFTHSEVFVKKFVTCDRNRIRALSSKDFRVQIKKNCCEIFEFSSLISSVIVNKNK